MRGLQGYNILFPKTCNFFSLFFFSPYQCPKLITIPVKWVVGFGVSDLKEEDRENGRMHMDLPKCHHNRVQRQHLRCAMWAHWGSFMDIAFTI